MSIIYLRTSVRRCNTVSFSRDLVTPAIVEAQREAVQIYNGKAKRLCRVVSKELNVDALAS